MTFLLILWWTALAIILLLLSAGFFLSSRHGVHGNVAMRLGDFLVEELRAIVAVVRHYFVRLTPHGRKAVAHVATHGRHIGGLFTEWVFGRIERKRGQASSFFLKHLAEHQHSLRHRAGERHGY